MLPLLNEVKGLKTLQIKNMVKGLPAIQVPSQICEECVIANNIETHFLRRAIGEQIRSLN